MLDVTCEATVLCVVTVGRPAVSQETHLAGVGLRPLPGL